MSAPVEYLPVLVRSGVVTDWERGFCASLIAQTRRGRRPTEKQAQTLGRIVEKFRRETMDDGVIE